MIKFNVYEDVGWGCECLVDTILAKTKEEALEMFFEKKDISNEGHKRLFYAISKEKDDEQNAILEETGHLSWDSYYNDLYPQRPIYV